MIESILIVSTISMWLRRSKSRAQIHNAPSHINFGCSSFKDIQFLLLSDDENNGSVGDSESSSSPRKAPICHRVRSFNSTTLLRTLSQTSLSEYGTEPEIRIPGAEQNVVVFYTSLRVVRPTFEACKAVQSILRSFRVSIDERDLSMDLRFTDQLHKIMGAKFTLPRVFIGGRYIGGVEEVRRLHESGELNKYMEGLMPAEPGTCQACGGYRFILCVDCSGSRRCYNEKTGFRSCMSCNENGLIRCPSCSTAPL